MSLNINDIFARIGSRKRTGWSACGTALLSFAAGSLLTAHWTHLEDVKADSHRVFQLEIYHAVPGKVPALEERFRSASQLQAKHNLDVIGYWVPTDNTDPAFANTFVYLVAHANQEDAKKNWDAFHSDPAFQEYVKSERTEKLIEGVDSTFMRPTDYSKMK
jgi:NIPSNAP